jgi:ribosome recycling factor
MLWRDGVHTSYPRAGAKAGPKTENSIRKIGKLMNDWQPRMHKTVTHLAEQLAGIRTGSINVRFIETLRVDCLGNSTSMRQIGVIKQQGDRILVTPFDKEIVPAVVRALGEARLNAYARNPTTISVSVPPISTEQRGEIARHVKKLGEDARIAIRAIRQDARKQIEVSGRGSQRRVQDATDAAVGEIERLVKGKLDELER